MPLSQGPEKGSPERAEPSLPSRLPGLLLLQHLWSISLLTPGTPHLVVAVDTATHWAQWRAQHPAAGYLWCP